jgi:hypothetical protein
MPTPPRRRWFQFGLRTLVVVVMMLAIPLAWLRSELIFIHRRQAFLEMLERQRATRTQTNVGALMRVHGLGFPTRIPWWRKCLGDQPQTCLVVPADTPHEDVEELFPEIKHDLRGD